MNSPLAIGVALVTVCAVGCGSKSASSPVPSETPSTPDGTDMALVPSRESKIASDAVKITPEMDRFTPQSRSAEYGAPVPLPYPINTPGAEDSPFILPDGKTLYLWFTPDPQVLIQQQLVDGVTGIYVAHKHNGSWSKPQRVILQDPGKLSLDGCVFVRGQTMWFCSARTGYTGMHWFTAQWTDGKWSRWVNADFDPEYEVGELHITADGRELYFHSSRPGGQGKYDLWVSTNVAGQWKAPQNLAMVNSPHTDGWPMVTEDGNELWFTRAMGAPELYRSKKTDGRWQEPVLMFSPFAGEPTVDEAGNVYFTHHFYKDDVMLEADIYVAHKK